MGILWASDNGSWEIHYLFKGGYTLCWDIKHEAGDADVYCSLLTVRLTCHYKARPLNPEVQNQIDNHPLQIRQTRC